MPDFNQRFMRYLCSVDEFNCGIDEAMVDGFLSKVDLNYIEPDSGRTFIHCFVENCDNGRLLERLITKTNANAQDSNGITPLFIAFEHWHVWDFQKLRGFGADLFHLDARGGNILHYYVRNGRFSSTMEENADIFAFLSSYEISTLLDQRDSNGKTPEDLLVKKILHVG